MSTEYQRDVRRSIVNKMYLQSISVSAIAKHLDISIATVESDLAHLRQSWLDTAAIDTRDHIAKEIARIDNMEAVAWKEWRKSQKDAVTKEESSGTGAQGGEWVSAKIVTKGQTGSTRYLAVIQWCIEQRAKLLGLMPKDDSKQGDTIVNINWDSMGQRSTIVDPVEERIRRNLNGMGG